ncbi:hypothetical protein LMH87_006662 [Akanthomyces muscarius]|uniref:Uncharacterized protein n=1 Tax=Akanthomyces muscarius TaxID=2231603 RepID=A0A9W8QP82_AKAMU|nr:hypothetical protein LMH87_006662 [Akanthomyces muscarius]KAJ4165013.1 hypothetical protein LMH87_006662 [Akanthomyces muscarius]
MNCSCIQPSGLDFRPIPYAASILSAEGQTLKPTALRGPDTKKVQKVFFPGRESSDYLAVMPKTGGRCRHRRCFTTLYRWSLSSAPTARR